MSHARFLIAVLALAGAALVILACGGVPAATGGKSGIVATVLTPPTHSKVGSPVTIGGQWLITVNKVETYGGGVFDTNPGAGNTYLLITVTMKNISSAQRSANSYDYGLRDLDGNQEQVAILYSYANFGGNVTPGEQVRGTLTFLIPQKVHQYLLSFAPLDAASTGTLAEWDVTQ